MLDRIAETVPEAFGPWGPLGLPLGAAAIARYELGALLDGPSPEDALGQVGERVAEGGGPTLSPHLLQCAATLHALARLVCVRHLPALEGAAARAEVPRRSLDQRLPVRGEGSPGQAAAEVWLLGLAAENEGLGLVRDLLPLDPELVGTAAQVELALAGQAGEVDLPALLRAPLRAHPGSLRDQLAAAVDAWRAFVPDAIRELALRVVDAADEALRFRGGGPGPQAALVFEDEELERFTPDRFWMRDVVIIARLTHVWLDQLSKKYGRHIHRLDQIPDEELDLLRRWGFTGLWLIGLCQRSHASREIKRRMGNPDALASAYALWDTNIADDLGGEAALQDLQRRAWERGIRLAADMVPNHVGVDGRWVSEHPDWFVQTDHPPFPGYSFDGPDLSTDERVAIQLEDGYWDHSDAAVVFRRTDRHTGETRYIFHGNDGTSMPWNDTAQIDFLNSRAREAVIDTILDVARRFPIIRMDAAMVLARRHVRRLWHPPPGEGGAIPSRARYAATPEAFDAAMPNEFWREVVDRINAERPDTLLLAEAFWMLEGYFVRTLGMHRVYNSAFMNMLKREENAKYRETLRNVLQHSPAVLERFVNFMNNPDEETAVAQFGDGDKYVGICVMMVTLPGLPMFGHGQIEGFSEKYGMEYPRAYWDEPPNEQLVARHEREIFPLMRRRHLFSGADSFELYDFSPGDGAVCEDVFAYTNRAGHDRALVLYNNAYPTVAGWVRDAVPTVRGVATLASALGIERGRLYAFRDHGDGLSYLRSGDELADRGLYAELPGFRYHVFLGFNPTDDLWDLAEHLDGGGVPDLPRAAAELRHAEELRALESWLEAPTPERWGALLDVLGAEVEPVEPVDALPEVRSAKLQRALDLKLPTAPLAELLRDFSGRIEDTLESPTGRRFLRLNRHGGRRWFHEESMDALLAGLEAMGHDAADWHEAAAASGCDLDRFLAAID